MKNVRKFILPILLFAGFLHADVKGVFKVNGKDAIVPAHAGAYVVRDQFNPRTQIVELMLSEGMVDAKAAAEDLDPHVNAINQEQVREGNYILFWIGPDAKPRMNATLSKSMAQYLLTPEEGLKAELSTNTKERVAGRIYTAQPVKTMNGDVIAVDVTFDTSVNRRATGTALPAGGGDAGKAFLALHAAVKAKNMQAIRANVSDAVFNLLVKDYNTPEENLQSAVDILTARLPKKNIKIIGGELLNEQAVLEVEGEMFEGTNALYLVKMIKSPSGWQYDQSAPAGMLK